MLVCHQFSLCRTVSQMYLGVNFLPTATSTDREIVTNRINSGINSAAVLMYFARDPYWQAKAREEVKAVALKYAKDKNAPLIDQLQQLPSHAWEGEFPIVDMCLRESIRLQYASSSLPSSS
jgi:hypothetical protein